MTGPLDEDRPGDPKTTKATNHQHHDQQATTPPDAGADSSADTIGFAELLTRLGYGTHTRAKRENVSVPPARRWELQQRRRRVG